MPSTDLVASRPEHLAIDDGTVVAKLRGALEAIPTLEVATEIREALSFAGAVAAAAEALAAHELAQAAITVRLRAEHRAGELRRHLRESGALTPIGNTTRESQRTFDYDRARRLLADGLSLEDVATQVGTKVGNINALRSRLRNGQELKPGYLYDFDLQVGATGTLGGRWETLARIPWPALERTIDDLKAEGGELTTYKIYRRAAEENAEKIEPGIYRLPSGVLQIRWTEGGRRRSQSMDSASVSVTCARSALLEKRGRKTAPSRTWSDGLDDVYGDVRAVLSVVDRLLPKVKPRTRRHLEEVMSHLHGAEDALGRAMREEEL